MARVKLIREKSDLAPEYGALFDELAAMRGRISGPSTVVLHSPALAGIWNQQSEFLHRESVLDLAAAELAMSATAREKDCAYIWGAHAPGARKAGASDAAVAVVRDRLPVDGLPAAEANVITYVRQLLRTNRVEQPVFDALLAQHGERGLVELTGFVGRYAALAGFLNAFEVPPNDGAEVLPITPPLRPLAGGPARPPLASPRITPVTQRAQVAAGGEAVFDQVAEGRGTVRGPFSILMHSPGLCKVVVDVSDYLRRGLLSPADRELATLATARERDCPYVWGAHAAAGRRVGVREEAIAAIGTRAGLDAFTDAERDIVDWVRQLAQTNRVEQPLFDRLQAARGVPWMVELTALMGHYGLVTAMLNAFEVAPSVGAEPLPA